MEVDPTTNALGLSAQCEAIERPTHEDETTQQARVFALSALCIGEAFALPPVRENHEAQPECSAVLSFESQTEAVDLALAIDISLQPPDMPIGYCDDLEARAFVRLLQLEFEAPPLEELPTELELPTHPAPRSPVLPSSTSRPCLLDAVLRATTLPFPCT